MTEREYTMVRNISELMAGEHALRNVLPGFDNVIDKKELRRICNTIYRWQDALRELVETCEVEEPPAQAPKSEVEATVATEGCGLPSIHEYPWETVIANKLLVDVQALVFALKQVDVTSDDAGHGIFRAFTLKLRTMEGWKTIRDNALAPFQQHEPSEDDKPDA